MINVTLLLKCSGLHGIKMESAIKSWSRDPDELSTTDINWSKHYSQEGAYIFSFEPLWIKLSTALGRKIQVIKDNFDQKRFLIPVSNASIGDM